MAAPFGPSRFCNDVEEPLIRHGIVQLFAWPVLPFRACLAAYLAQGML